MSALFDNQIIGKKIIEKLPLYHGLRSVYEFVFKTFDFETKYQYNMLKKQVNKYYSAQRTHIWLAAKSGLFQQKRLIRMPM